MYYLLMSLSVIATCLAVWLIYYATYKPHQFNKFCDNAYYGSLDSQDRNRQQKSMLHSSRLWRATVIILGVIGIGLLSYGVSRQLVGWIPLAGVSADDDNLGLVGIVTTFTFIEVLVFLERVHKMALYYHQDSAE